MSVKKPNILIFMTDQQRGDSVYPYNKAKTPNVEKFAKDGVVFAQTHTIAPHCCPSRATLWSGLFPTEHGVWNNVNVGNAISRGLYDGVTLFPELFQKSGYRSYYAGKWHVSNYESPSHRGFDYYEKECDNQNYAGCSNNLPPFVNEWKQYEKYVPQETRGEGEIIRRGYSTYTHYMVEDRVADDKIIENSIKIIKDRAKYDQNNEIKKDENAPWLQVVSSNAPHDPYGVPQKYLDLYDINDIELPESFCDTLEDKPALYRRTAQRFAQLTEEEHKKSLQHYLAACTYQDEKFGEVMAELEKSGEMDNTIVIYISDHGDYAGEHGLWCKGLPCFQGAYHIPLIIGGGSDLIKGGRIIKDFTSIADIAPTLLDICEIPHDHHMTGYSLKNYLQDATPEYVQDAIYTQSNGNELYGIQRSVKTKKYKYVYNGFDMDEFYDLENDPNEMKNIYEESVDSPELKNMSKKMWEFARKTGDVCVNPYIMVGLSSFGPGILFE